MATTCRTMTALALAVGLAVLPACGTARSAEAPTQGPPAGTDRPAGQAQEYAGDPWEHRSRAQFLASQHVHDSWNPCHLGENVPTSVQDRGPRC